MFGDEKTIGEVSALIQKQNCSTTFQDLYSVLDWQPFRYYRKVEERTVEQNCLEVMDDRKIDELASPIFDMPVYILLKILAYLDAKALCSLSQTCTHFHSLCEDHLLWKELLGNDKLKWTEVGHSTNPSSLQALHANMSLKSIYLRCSPDMRKKEKFNFLRIPRLIKSYFPHQVPKVILFGPGLDSDTSRIVRKMLNTEENEVFRNKGPFAAMFPGSVGTGFTISVADGSALHHMRMITLYSGAKKSREVSPLENRSQRSRLLQRVDRNEEDVEPQFEPTDSIKQLCGNVNAFICVVESSQQLETVSGCMEELHSLLDLKWTPHTSPLLVLSCIPDHDTARIPCVTIAEQLKLSRLVRQWKVVDAIVSDLQGVSGGIKWLIETAQGTA